MEFYKVISDIQAELKSPKDKKVSFGKTNYDYRSCEGILASLKPLLKKHGLHLTMSDEAVVVGVAHKISDGGQDLKKGIIAIKSIVKVSDGENHIEASAYAGIESHPQGMNIAQSFGASSSYARKYALCGLFAIDDGIDSDSLDKRQQSHPSSTQREVNVKTF